MVMLAAAETYFAFDGGTVLLGFFTALIPVARDESNDRIQWHLESLDEKAGEVMSVQKLRELVTYEWLNTTPANIHGKTCFLGWSSNANILLGTRKLVESKPSMTWTQGLKVRTRGTENDGFEIGGQLGVSIPGVSPVLKASKSYKFIGYTTRRQPISDYRSALDCLQNKVSLLIDSESKQAWLVPLLSLVLHLCHRYFQFNNTSNQPNPIPFAQTSPKGYESSKDAIADCGSLTVFGDEADDDRLLFRTLLFRILLNLNDHPRNTTSKWKQETHVMANELMDAVMHHDASPKLIPLAGENYSWPDLLPFAEVADSVGVCANIGPAIAPEPEGSSCVRQTELPTMRGYLAVHLRSLRVLCVRGGYCMDEIKTGRCHITHHTCWVSRSDPWSQCGCPHECLWGDKKQDGKIPQETKSRWKYTELEHPQSGLREVPEDGAVVFGRNQPRKSVFSNLKLIL